MSTRESIDVRAMQPGELTFAVDLAAKEGWNPGLNDAACFYDADPEGFLIGERNGEPIGCISAVSYAGRYGFIGLYIVRPEFRGRGYGMQLWHAAMERLNGHNVGLDGVLAQQANYKKSGFQLAYRNIRYASQVRRVSPPHESIAPAAEAPFEQIAELDRRVFPERRDAFLKGWLAQPDAGAFVARHGNGLTGYTVVRRCREGWKVGPLVAVDLDVAERLLLAAEFYAGANSSPRAHDEPLYLDVPEANPAALELARGRGMSPVFETARMYTGSPPNISLNELFGVTTFELG